jgi:acid phosphatase
VGPRRASEGRPARAWHAHPAIIVSPLAKKGTVDYTQYDTASILRLITRRFGLDTLPGLAARDNALTAAGDQAMGDLTNALNLQ